MTYLDDSRDERLDPAQVLPTARSVISRRRASTTPTQPVARRREPPSPAARVIARYARGDDYHEVLRARLRALVRGWPTRRSRLEAFSCVDNGPVQERVFAEQAGLGWIGKNTCLINPRLGSWLVLGGDLHATSISSPTRPASISAARARAVSTRVRPGAIVEPYVVDAAGACRISRSRSEGAVAERMAGGDSRAGVRLRHLPGRLSVEPPGGDERRPGVAAAGRRCASPRLLDLCRLSDEAGVRSCGRARCVAPGSAGFADRWRMRRPRCRPRTDARRADCWPQHPSGAAQPRGPRCAGRWASSGLKMPRGMSLAPALLLSMPQLIDPNFARTVVLLCEHAAGGRVRPGREPAV